jgi:hypothetical protein
MGGEDIKASRTLPTVKEAVEGYLTRRRAFESCRKRIANE